MEFERLCSRQNLWSITYTVCACCEQLEFPFVTRIRDETAKATSKRQICRNRGGPRRGQRARAARGGGSSACGQPGRHAGDRCGPGRPRAAFNIAAGPLDGALAEFERVTGIKVVLANPGIGTVQSPGVSGALTPARAMEALLAGTSVRATFGTDAVRLDVRGVSEFVAVDSAAPKMSSPKYRAPILDTPQTVVVIPQQVFQEQGATSLREVLRNTPGITMSIGEGGSGGTSSGDNVLIRGFSARNDIYIDGARDPGLVSRDAFNTEVGGSGERAPRRSPAAVARPAARSISSPSPRTCWIP